MASTAPVRTGIVVLELAQAGRFAEIRDMFAPALRALVSAEALQAAWSSELQRQGPVAAIGAPTSDSAVAGMVTVRIPVTFEHGELAAIVSMDESGQLTGIQLAPASAAQPVAPWEPPDYADRDTFDEYDVTVGSGPLAVPGTLSMPRQPGEHTAVVLLGGSGPVDRDETIGRNKPFKDLAWGLSSQGFAVLRFDKVTYAHGNQLANVSDFTVTDEYVHHAIAAVHLLREHSAVSAAQVFVLGHSLGGTVAPRVAVSEPSVAGLVILAGGAQPMHWAAVRQVRYLASLNPATATAAESAIEAMSRQATMIDSPDLSPSTPTSELLFGVPAEYWLDLRGYQPAAVAAGLGKPMLILQGGRDYQATVDDDLARWKEGLAGCQDITIRVYEPDNHLFFPGTGLSSPAEYEPAQHMDPAVIGDIANWLTAHS